MKVQHSLMMFQESLRSKESIKTYTWTVDQFIKYHNLKKKNYDSTVAMEKKELQSMVETYVIHLKRTIGPNSISTYANHLKTFLESNDIDLNWRKIKRLYPAMVKRSGHSAYTTEDVQKMLNATTPLKNRAVIHFLASTCVRIGAVPDLSFKHLRDMPLGCKMVTVYENSTEEYQTFLTPEATKALDDYLEERKKHNEILDDESPLFRERYLLGITKPKRVTKTSLQALLRRSIQKTIVRGQKKNGRYAEQLAHGFRKRFNTVLKLNKEVNDNVIEKMMGHKRGLDGTYLVITPEMAFNEFKNGIMDLTIDGTARKQAELDQANKDKSELQKKVDGIKDMKRQQEDENARRDQALEYLMKKEKEREKNE